MTPMNNLIKMAGQGIGKRRFLFLMWDGAGGTIVEARIARQLLRRGHEVTVLGPATIESELRSLGCGYVLDHAMAPCSALRDAPPDELAWLRDHLWLGPARAYAHEIVATVAEVRADAVVTSGYLYGGMVGAQSAGLPAAALCTSLYGMPYRARELPAGDARRDFWEVGLKALNDARISLGLPELASVFAQRDALERLLLRQGEVIQTVLDALADLPLHGIVTLGPALNGARLRVPENVTIFDHLPHAAVLPVAAAMVTHAGHGTVMAALAYGVPMVCIPMGCDQYHIAERVASVGAGLVVDRDSAAGVIRRAIREVLNHPGFRQHAAVMRRAIDDTLRDNSAVHELEALRSTAAPSSSGYAGYLGHPFSKSTCCARWRYS